MSVTIFLLLFFPSWAFIPTSKKPSSERAKDTHERVCTHYNFAKRCKECCDFPTLLVRPRLQSSAVENKGVGDTVVKDEANHVTPSKGKTVAKMAGSMCDGFTKWAEENKLHDVPDDYGWNEMSAYVQMDS